jgi:hypothetical protein
MYVFLILLIILILFFENKNYNSKEKFHNKNIVLFNEEDYYSSTLGLTSGDIVYNDDFYGILIEYNPNYNEYINNCPLFNNINNYGFNMQFDNYSGYYDIKPKNKILLIFGTDGNKLYLFPANRNFLIGKKIKKRNVALDDNDLQRLLISINKFYEINYINKREMFIQQLLMDANIIPYYVNQTQSELIYSDNSFNTKKRDEELNYLLGYMNSYIYN